MERLTDDILESLKLLNAPEKPLSITVWYDRVVLGDDDGNTAQPDEVYYAMRAANAFPILIAEVEYLRKLMREYRSFLVELAYTGRDLTLEGVSMRARELLEKEG